MANLSEIVSFDNPIFKSYSFWSGVLVIKMLLMAFFTVIQRVKNKAVASKEDSPKGIVIFSEDVERQRRAHLNDIENIPVFIIVTFFYLLTSPNEFLAINLVRIVAVCRIIHTISYAIFPTQPARAISYMIALGASMCMALHTAFYFY